ncbi:hypothetical protein CFBP7900_35530 [Xanthomonas hortorum pv. carotae]|uniref:Uncharacterized protein n=1 Tax=Xanthomonas hortorum pv. carotae TaxID=487904 RepID=A0A6V7FEA3_9XANT|nr:hypothetical protein CFBP7900_35530 [Xanthomonas hortorum pv. carotae]CAD0361669.1 hypothetical protein CFBP7900_35530 [Xanthomonas hortorum pv. carotae]
MGRRCGPCAFWRNAYRDQCLRGEHRLPISASNTGSAVSRPGAGPCGGMDAATEPPRMDLRRVPTPDVAPRSRPTPHTDRSCTRHLAFSCQCFGLLRALARVPTWDTPQVRPCSNCVDQDLNPRPLSGFLQARSSVGAGRWPARFFAFAHGRQMRSGGLHGGSFIAHARIEDDQHLAHHRHKGDLALLAACPQRSVKIAQTWLVPS